MKERWHLVVGIAVVAVTVAVQAAVLVTALVLSGGPAAAEAAKADAAASEAAAPAPAAAAKPYEAATAAPAPAVTPKETAAPPSKAATPAPASAGTDGSKRLPIEIKYPRPMFEGTPKNIKPSPTIEKYVDKDRPPFLAPEGTKNVAAGRPVTSSDSEPIIGRLDLLTDGDKEGTDGSFVELGPGRQWIQIDLGGMYNIYAVLLWHYHGEGRVYHDVVVQAASDPDFVEGVQTLYNNDFDNSSGLGIGKDLEYIESYRGRLIAAQGVKARYIRCWSKGNTSNDQNHYIEIEVYGKSAQ